jgi:hypothetical protein
MDKFYEQFVFTRKSKAYHVLNALMYLVCGVAAVYLFFGVFMMFSITYIVFLVAAVALFFVVLNLRDKQYKEYEYIFTNGNLQIDVIYNKKKRKTIVEEDIKSFDDFGKASEIKVPGNAEKIVCIPWDNNNEAYVFVVGRARPRACYFVPNEHMLQLINMYNIRGVRR